MLILFIGDVLSYYLALVSAYFTRDFLDEFVHIPFHFSISYLVTEYLWIPVILVIVITSKGLYSLRKPFWHENYKIIRQPAAMRLKPLRPYHRSSLLLESRFTLRLTQPFCRQYSVQALTTASGCSVSAYPAATATLNSRA